jgi:hypothetical protein
LASFGAERTFLYRVSGDPYYVEQIARYADGAQWLLDHRPQQFLRLLAFAPDLLAVNRRYARNDAGRGHLTELMLLYAGRIYRVAEKRRLETQ